MSAVRALATIPKFEPSGYACGNEIIRCEGFTLSYNASPGMSMPMWSADDDGVETAICVDGDFYILNGDFREEYARLSTGGLIPCLQFFASKPDLISSWSSSAEKALARIQGGES